MARAAGRGKLPVRRPRVKPGWAGWRSAAWTARSFLPAASEHGAHRTQGGGEAGFERLHESAHVGVLAALDVAGEIVERLADGVDHGGDHDDARGLAGGDFDLPGAA